MSTQELLTNLFNVIALGFTLIAAIDFTLRLVVVYQQVSIASSSSKKELPAQQSISELSSVAVPQVLLQLPDPWLLPLPVEEAVASVKLVQKEQKHLRLLPPALATNVSNPEPKLEDWLRGVELENLKLRQARKIAKVLGIAQKVNGRDQKLAFLVSQIKVKLQQETWLQPEVIKLISEARLAS